MISYLQYIFEANVTLIVLGLFYYFFFRNETQLQFRRFYILGTTLVALIIPFLHFDLIFNSGNNEAVKTMQTIFLPEIIIGNQSIDSSATGISLLLIVKMIYLSGIILLLAWLIFQVGQVIWFFLNKRSHIQKKKNHALILTNGTLPTFSFFRLLFLDNSIELTELEKRKILAHEETHIRQWHSLDTIFLDLVKIIFWFNPICWYFRIEIQNIHEYIADESIIRYSDTEQYSSLLAKITLTKAHLSIGHHFNKSKTLKRIKMMNQSKTKISSWKWMMMVSVFGLVLITFSCNDDVMNDMQEVTRTSTMSTDIPADMQAKMGQLKKENPDLEFGYIETDMDNKEKVEKLKELDPHTIAAINVDKEASRIGVIIVKNGVMKKWADATKTNGDIFTVVDNPALPPGGYPGFYHYIAENLKYPAQARKLGVEGKVYIQFVVGKDGSIADVTPVKGIGAGCDSEAVRVIANSPKWSPPTQNNESVRQRIILPISFVLDDSSTVKEDSN